MPLKTLWKADQPQHPAFAELNHCLHEDWFLLPFEIELQRAHAHTLQAADILSPAETAALMDALDNIAETHGSGPCPGGPAEDLHTWIEGQLTERAGDAGRRIHTARSRNDQVATLLRMFVIDCGEQLAADLQALALTCCRRAQEWSELVMPLQTHQQFAAPGSVGFWMLRFATAFARARGRVRSNVVAWRQHCPLGAGAVAGSAVPIDRDLQARLLRFEGPALNALDATTSRDECLELLALDAQLALHAQSFATDIIIFSQTPQQWLKYPAGFGTGSSMMPNKFNPDAMELLRGECNAIIAAQTQAALLLKGLPSGYSRDLQCIKPMVRDSAYSTRKCLSLLDAFVQHMDFDGQRLDASLSAGHIDATLRMEARVRQGEPLRAAHHAVADELQTHALPTAAAMHAAVHDYQTIGAASPSETCRIADELIASLK